MSFTAQSFSKASVTTAPVVELQSGEQTGSPSIWSYNTQDTIATVLAANYFSDVAGTVKVGDLIYIFASDQNSIAAVRTIDDSVFPALIDVQLSFSGTVTEVSTGTGLTGGPITTLGTISLANTAVTPGSYTLSNITVDQQGRLTAASSGSGAVTSVATGTGLTGGPITSSGTISMANTAVTPGSYTFSNLTVDQQGRITAASSGSAQPLSTNLTDIAALSPTASSLIYGNGTHFSNFVPSIQQVVYVSKNGNDTTGNGSVLFPYLTLTKALTVITDASSSKKYGIFLDAGRYDEASNIVLKPYIWLIGYGSNLTYITSPNNQITPDSTFGAGNTRCGIINVYVGGSTGLNWDISALGSSSCVMDLIGVSFNGALTFKGRALGADFLQMFTSYSFGDWTLQDTQGFAYSCFSAGDIHFSGVNAGGGGAGFNLNSVTGSNWTFSAAAGKAWNWFVNASSNPGTLSVTGASGDAHLYMDVVSFPTVVGSFTTSGSPTINKISNSYALAYVPTTSGNWNATIPADVTAALDQLASRVKALGG